MSLQIDVKWDDSIAVVKLVGAADLAGAETFDHHLTLLSARRPGRVVFDLAGLTMISSICIGSLVAFRRGCEARGGRVALAAPNEFVGDALRRSRLDVIFPMHATVEAALGAA